jgi:hypothetical protein
VSLSRWDHAAWLQKRLGEARQRTAELEAENERLREMVERYQPIIAALGIYGENANLAALVEKVRTFPEMRENVEPREGAAS